MAKKYPNCRKKQVGKYVYWICRLVFEKDPFTGVQRKPKDFTAKTAAEAHRLREEYRKEWLRNPKADHEATFGTFLESQFIPYEEARYKSGILSWGRYRDRKSRLTRFVLEAESARQLRSTVLGDLAPETLERFFDRLLIQKVSGTLWNMVRQDLLLALRKARRKLRYPVSDFFEDIKSVPVEVKRQKLFDADLIRERIFDEALPLESRAWLAFIFFIPCRPNEMMPLLWSDIDWKKGAVTICKALTKAESGFEVKGSTKTGRKGDREAPLGSLLADLLRRIQRSRMASGIASEYIFCRSDGLPHTKDTFKYAWRRIRKDLVLPDGPTFYSLKKTAISDKSKHGTPDKVIAELCGHRDTRMVQNTYRHVDEAELLRAVEISAGDKLRHTG